MLTIPTTDINNHLDYNWTIIYPWGQTDSGEVMIEDIPELMEHFKHLQNMRETSGSFTIIITSQTEAQHGNTIQSIKQ